MAYAQGTIANTGEGAMFNYFAALRNFCESTLGWEVMRTGALFANPISTITRSGTTATVTVPLGHDLSTGTGSSITIYGATDPLYNGTFANIVNISSTQFSYTMSGTPAANATGTFIGSGYTPASRQVIWKAPGNGSEQIYILASTVHDNAVGYANILFRVATGFIASNSIGTHPGIYSTGCVLPMWNAGVVDYIFIGDGNRIIAQAKTSTYYHIASAGKFLPYASPSQWPYPVYVLGTSTTTAQLYSNTTSSFGYKGSSVNLAIRMMDGTWRNPQVLPFTGNTTLRNTKNDSTANEATLPGYFGIHPLILSENTPGYVSNYGEFDGVYYITGFANASENTLVIGGITYYVMQDVNRNGNKDYIALRLS